LLTAIGQPYDFFSPITGIGYCGMDYLCRVPYVPIDDKVELADSLIQGGGPCATAMVAAARLGANATFCGAVGDDERGARILRGLADEGVNTAGVKVRRKAVSPVSFCWIDAKTRDRSIAWARGTARPLGPREIDRAGSSAATCCIWTATKRGQP
jgi:ribokinase